MNIHEYIKKQEIKRKADKRADKRAARTPGHTQDDVDRWTRRYERELREGR